jgi:hypothetical protein
MKPHSKVQGLFGVCKLSSSWQNPTENPELLPMRAGGHQTQHKACSKLETLERGGR